MPTSHYAPKLHATELEGVDQPAERGNSLLSIVAADGTPLPCEKIALVDWAETAGEQFGREVTAFGIDVDRL